MKNRVLPTTVVGSYVQPGWLIDRDNLKTRLPPRVRAQEIWQVPENTLEEAQDTATLAAIHDMEQAGIDIVGKIDQESQSPFLHTNFMPLVVQLRMLGLAALRYFAFEKHVGPGDSQGGGRRFHHQVEPIGMLGATATVWAFEFDQVQVVFVTVDSQWDFRYVAIVDPKASNAPFSRPAAEMTGALGETIVKKFRLLLALAGQATENWGADQGRSVRGDGRGVE